MGRGGGKGNGKSAHTEYYELLAVQSDATPEELKRAYRKRALRLHPDRGGDPEEFKRMKAAYDVLSDPSKRKVYDKYGADAVKVMDGEMPSSAAFIGKLRFRDRIFMVLFLAVFSAIILAFPILLSIRVDAEAKGEDPFSWAVPLVPLWCVQVLSIVYFTLVERQAPLDWSNPDIDEEAREAWRSQERALNKKRAHFYTSLLLTLAGEILIVLRLDRVITFSWSLVLLPLTIMYAGTFVIQVLLAPAVFTSSDPRFNPPPDEEGSANDRAVPSRWTLLREADFWVFAFDFCKWPLAVALTFVLAGVVADQLEEQKDVPAKFWLAAIPILTVLGIVLIMHWIVSCASQSNASPAASGEEGENIVPPQPGVIGVFIGWLCKYGVVLIIVCLSAAKLSDLQAFSAFWIFFPVFLIVGCGCCMVSIVAITVTEEDLKSAEQEVQQQQQQQQQQHEHQHQSSNLNPDSQNAQYATFAAADGQQSSGTFGAVHENQVALD